jgi:hypothetical protein
LGAKGEVNRPKGMSQYLEINDTEAQHLAWIHSNKFTIPDLFHKKFYPQGTYRNACYVLSKYVKKGFLLFEKENMFAHNFYFLSLPAIRTLDETGRMIVMGRKHPIRINPYERQHDLMVQELRITLEACPSLVDIFWVSDFEMRAGITPRTKAEFLNGELESNWRVRAYERAKSLVRRTPDGYFEADFQEDRRVFVLEFERTAYNWNMVKRMVYNLDDAFPQAHRLVVSETAPHARRMIRNLQAWVMERERSWWYVSDFEKVITRPFEKCWYQISHPLEQ